MTCLDVMMVKHLSTGACHSVLFKLVMAILRHESSEALRRRYGSKFHYLYLYFLIVQHKVIFCPADLYSVFPVCDTISFVHQPICIALELFPVLPAYDCSGCPNISRAVLVA